MRDQPGRASEKLSIFVAERVHFFAFRVEHSDDVAMPVRHGDNNFRARAVKSRQVARIFPHIAHHDRLARFKSGPAQALGDRKTRIGRRLIAGASQDDEFLSRHFVNADPAILARDADHFRDFPHSFWCALTRENKRANFLQGLARFGFHREKTIWRKKL